ncbi:acyl-CoA synthetase [Actinocorallia sp. A-T 12471]|uniref:acyl-CoA synthetase n=1 Tax=Actinocorallia sp. A-T 12471 TaxID=3089813 RepID=UPI0029CBA28E|nr:acyl-CoA synthetase [Actinocorallia sp. A-T 12471]MDX6743227.1 acyl-CoA synthetase [Actinocorallia sp. A-T 12471]
MDLGTIAGRTPDKPAVIMTGSGRVVTFGELDAASNRLAQVFYAAGIRAGEHVAVMMENRWELLAVAWAAQRSGLYYTAVSNRLTVDEAAYIVDNCGAKAFVASPAVGEVAAQIAAGNDRLVVRLMPEEQAPGFDSYEDVVAAASPEPLAEQLEGVDMLYSSGTTGRPKGIKPKLERVAFGEQPGILYSLIQMLFAPDEDSVYLCPAPLYHAAPLRYSMAFHRFGATVVVMEKFDPEEALKAVERYGVTHGQWVPTMFIRMLKLPEEVRKSYDLSSMKYAVHAAAPCPVPVKHQMIEWWGPILHEYYAGTEGNCFVYTDSEGWLAHPGTVGRVLLGEVHVVGPDDEEVSVGETGTLYFGNGPQFEYHGDPEKTKSSQDPLGRGWTTLGDIGHVDADGFLYLTDRQSHMIISGGVNIYPQEAENLLAVHPKVADVAVFGVPHPEMGEEVKAVVQLADPADAGDAVAAELIAYCRDNLAHFKCPRSIDFRDELPRHPTGKLLKRVLRDEYSTKS